MIGFLIGKVYKKRWNTWT